jgi:hypothetical protein
MGCDACYSAVAAFKLSGGFSPKDRGSLGSGDPAALARSSLEILFSNPENLL